MYLICTLAICCLLGCSSHEARLEMKRQFAIDRARQDFNSRSVVFRRIATNDFVALSSANVVTLKTPQVASAAMGKDEEGEYRLWVFWLENKPSIDNIELSWSKTNSSVIIPVAESDSKENVKTSDVSVVMVGRWVWSNTNNIWSKLEKIDDVSEIKIRLLKGSETKTAWHPVSFYRLDHWMGSKQVMEMTNGNTASIKAN